MKRLLILAGVIASGSGAFAQGESDSLRSIDMESIQVTSTRAGEKTPMVYTNLAGKEIARQNFGQDLPFLLQITPSVVVTSDAGAGIGYTSIRIRGTDPTRINVTANGIPVNDAESHSVYWVNMPDFASSAGSMQIQRGVGTSTNGAGAFGGSVNILTESLSVNPYAEFSGSYGSYNTHRESVKLGTGLLGGHWAFGARLSNIHSDGYIDRASTDLRSYFVQGGYYGRSTTLRFITFGGKEKTYHAWNGIDGEQLAANRRYNPSGEIEQVIRDADGYPVLDAKGRFMTEVTGFYRDQTDNYTQTHYQLLLAQRLSDAWELNAGLHYTDGSGYYEEYKNARTLVEYGLVPFSPADPAKEVYIEDGKVVKSNLVRRKMMDNGFGGAVFSVDYRSSRLRFSLGGSANRYAGDHFGRVVWVQNYAANPSFSPDHEYYRNSSAKNDMNIYMKADWNIVRSFYFYGDAQYRRITHRIDGRNDTWDWNADAMQELKVDKTYDFFNPKAGILCGIGERANVYASVAVAHKEPTRNNFTDAKTGAVPKAERLIDYEAGLNYRNGQILNAGINLYFMKYKDQLVLTGEVNHIGEPLTDNVADSYRAGIEITAGARIAPWLRWDVNATLSRSRIKNYTEYLDDYDENWKALYTQTANYVGNTTVSFSPSVMAGSLISAEYKGWECMFQSNYVGKQYLTNSRRDDLSLDAYFINNLYLRYTFRFVSDRSLSLGLQINNVFNEKYCSNGWGGSSYIIADHGKPDESRERSDYAGYFPQAGTNILASVVIRF